MSTRRSFLQSALLLPSLFAVDAFAQDNASATFADFESGDYSDWTITDDAFGTRPATDALDNIRQRMICPALKGVICNE